MRRSLDSLLFEGIAMRSFGTRSADGSQRLDLLRRFVSEEGGQDLIEYAFLAAALAAAGMLALFSIGPTVGSTYSSWISPTTGSPALWQPAEPWTSSAGGGS